MSKRIFLRDYDWKVIQDFYDAGNSYREVSDKFGMNHSTISKAAKAGLFKSKTVSAGLKTTLHKFERFYSDERRQIMSAHAKRRELGGTRNSKRFIYNTVDGTQIKLDSSYEVLVAENLDENGIKWQRPGRFTWIDANEKDHTYRPDFFLVDYNVYLDPKHKGLIPLHADKIERVSQQNGISLLVLTVEQLNWSSIKVLMGL